ncbi:Piwi-like protein 2 [Bonamia ostreae]|uniref:Piwi-like protein 2 n=1 Tax=Bonamia ostreae TaxID=126728 RepID=A0ABV2ANJ2_9EUKA
MKEMFETNKNQKIAKKRIEDMIVDNVVITIHNRRLYRISEIDWNATIDDTFLKDGKKISYRDYFKNTYKEDCNLELKGMLVHRPRRRKNSTAAEKIMLPPELCHETGLSKKLKSNFQLMRKIADTTRIPAKKRHSLRTKLVSRLQKAIGAENSYDTDSNEGSQKGKDGVVGSSSPTREVVAAGSAITVESQIPIILSHKPVKLQGRILPEFKVSIADMNKNIRAVDPYTELQSGWNNAQFINKTIYKIRNWAVMGEDKRTMDQCVSQIRNVAQNANLLNTYISPNPQRYFVPNDRSRNNTNNWRKAIESVIEKDKPNIILVVLPDDRYGNPTAIYNLVKTICCTEKPVLSQCITRRNIMNQKRAGSVFKGCVKQMLIKMGNTPWRADLSVPDKSINMQEPTMICGMDVNHDMRRNCSTVSFVASYTSDYTKYNTFVYHQSFGREVVFFRLYMFDCCHKKANFKLLFELLYCFL